MELVKERTEEQPSMGMLSNALLYLEIRILKGKDPQHPFNSMVFIKADGEGTRGAEDRHLRSLSCTTELDTISYCINSADNHLRIALSC